MLASLFLAAALSSGAEAAGRCIDPRQPQYLMVARVVQVVDGDTIRVRLAGGTTERVRMIGIDAPEQHEGDKLDGDSAHLGLPRAAIQALGRRSSAFTRRHLGGRDVGLDLDVQRRDRHGRLLAYVWIRGILYNRLMLAEGYARVFTVPPNVRYASLFRACEREARENQRGLWR